MSTKASSRSASKETGNQKRIVQPQSQPRKLLSNDTLPQKGAGLLSRKNYMREYMKKIQNKDEFRINENKRKRYITKSTNV